MRRLLLAAALVATVTVVPGVPSAAGGGCRAPSPTQGSGTTVELGRNCMNPTTLSASGMTVTFVNRDPVPHNVIGADWGDDELAPGESFTHTFPEPGTYPYACTLHPGMVGAVQVGDALPMEPVAATDGSDGSGAGAVAAAVVFGLVGLVAGAGLGVRRRRPA